MKKLSWLLTLTATCLSCAPRIEKSEPRGKTIVPTLIKGPDSPAVPSQAQDIKDLLAELSLREKQLQQEQVDIKKLEKVNASLCSKLNEIRRSCLAEKPITQNALIRGVDCDGEIKTTPNLNRVEVVIKGGDPQIGQYSIVFSSNSGRYESLPLEVGRSKLEFTNLIDEPILSPKFSDVKQLRLKVLKQAGASNLVMKVLVEGNILLNQRFSQVTQQNEYFFDVKGIYEQMISRNCKVSESDMDQLLTKASSGIVSNEDLSGSVDTAAGVKIKELLDRQTWLNEALAQLSPHIEQARNRSFNLRKALRGDSGVGCHLNESISSLSLEIEGSVSGKVLINGAKSKLTSSGQPRLIKLDFGGDAFTTKIIDGKFVPKDDLSALKISSLTKIAIGKGGVEYNNLPQRCSGFDGSRLGQIVGNKKCYQIREESIMNFEKLTLTVNGIVIYKKGGLGIRLDRNKLSHSIDRLQSNPLWGEMLLRSDCSVRE